MARGGGRSRGAGAGKGRRKGAFNARSTKPTSTFFKQPAKATTKKKIPAVPMDDTWHQAVRRVYPGEGSCAFIRKAGLANDLEVLSPAHFGPQLGHMNCEAANRLGNYLSMLSASVEEGAHLLQMQRDEADKVGLAQVSACFDGDEGANLVQAAHVVNLSNKQEASPQQLQDAILGILSFLSDGSLVKSWQRIAKFSSHL